MKRILTLALALALGLLCISPAGAETIEEIRSELGSCSIEDYQGKTHHLGGAPYAYVESERDGMTVWELDWADEAGERLYGAFMEFWFPSRGIVADGWCDLDADGAQEWIVLFSADAVIEEDYEPYAGSADLWLQIYERDAQGVALADKLCLARYWDCFSVFTQLFVMERSDGTPALVIQDVSGVDSFDMNLWQLRYDGEALRFLSGMTRISWETGEAPLLLLGEGTSMELLRKCYHSFDIRDLEGGCYIPFDEDAEPVPVDVLGYYLPADDFSDENFDARKAEERAAFEEYLDAMELRIDLEGYEDWRTWDEESDGYDLTAHPAAGSELLLFRADCYALEEGRPVFRIERALDARLYPGFAAATGDCNLRAEPNLDAPDLGVIPKGARVEYLGEESVDGRGVAWYRVRYDGREGWTSSKYVRLD